ncbi:hypothetical protein TWF718_006563 [Orbilia javanica]|uniref:F-box domain-containing protein n=1 Tax=Orbilia javanica TaxID=47235 RepID=A0AAN8RHH3_9PEZI
MPFKDIIGSAPADIQIEILSYIKDHRELVRWARVSTTWRDFLMSPSLSPLYRRFLRKTWRTANYYLRRRAALASKGHQIGSICYRDLVFKLGQNDANIRAGSLHEAGSLVCPLLGKTKICYSDGFLAICSASENSDVERNVIYVYNLSNLQAIDSGVLARRVECEGAVKHIATSNGRLAYIAQDGESKTRVSIGVYDLFTWEIRRCTAEALNLDIGGLASIISVEGENAFTDEVKGRSSAFLQLPGSPEFFCTNGRYVVLSASFLTHYTIWDFGGLVVDPGKSMDHKSGKPSIGKSFRLDPRWVDYLFERWCAGPDFSDPPPVAYFMSIDDHGDIYATINGQPPDENLWSPDDRIFYTYACRSNGNPIPMHSNGWIPPNLFGDCHDGPDTIYVASDLVSFQSAGKNFLAISPPGYLDSYTGWQDEDSGEQDDDYDRMPLEYWYAQDLYYPRIALDRKRHTRESRLQGKPEFVYRLGYLGSRSFWLPRPDEFRGYEVLGARIIPNPSEDCAIWECRHKKEVIRTDGGDTITTKRVKIIGLRPTILPINQDQDEELVEEGEGEAAELVESDPLELQERTSVAEHADLEAQVERTPAAKSLNSIIPEAASVCELTMDYEANETVQWVGDEQQIILLERRTKNSEGQATGLQYENVFRIFRYGTASREPISFIARYTENYIV